MAFVYVARKGKKSDSLAIRFNLNNEKKTVYLGAKYQKKEANRIAEFVEEIVQCLETGRKFSKTLISFIEELGCDIRERFENAGLLEPDKNVTNAQLWDLFTDHPGQRKDSTMRTFETARKRFLAFFDPNSNPKEINEDDGYEFKQWLLEHNYSKATVATTFKQSKTVFNWAVKNGYMEINPFRSIPQDSMVNKDREFYVSMEVFEKILDACPDQQWRTIISLCRIGGLRNPSETLLLKWSDINWEKERILVHSPKTEHHQGKSERIIPLWPRLRIELERHFDLSEEGGSPFVITKWRDTASCMRTHFSRIIFRAGYETWPRLFHNLRGSRSNELFSQYPAHVASAWMGQSEKIANQHYLHVTDEQFKEAIKNETSKIECCCDKNIMLK